MMIVKWKGHSAAANQYQDRRNELIETAPSPWLLRLVPPPVRLFAEQEHRLLGKPSSRLWNLAQRPVPSPNELHQRVDQFLEEIEEVRRSIEQLNVDLNRVTAATGGRKSTGQAVLQTYLCQRE